ncbi:MAG: hypothetical protein R3261_11555, partial [Alphaproteobacteria bacterium]|nr:hypothetical protein [Alphaproteobacteria bacterium]
FSSPSNCDMDCVIEVVSNNTGPLADDLGSTLSRRLSHLHGGREISKDKPTSGNKTVNLGSGSDYVFNLVGFNTEEALEIMRVMSKEFPGYKTHDLINRENRRWSYEYRSSASLAKLEKWVNILLLDMGYDPDRDVDISFRDNSFTLNLRKAKMSAPTGNSSTGSSRFK